MNIGGSVMGVRFFLANSVQDEGDVLEEMRTRALGLMTHYMPGQDIHVTTGKEDFLAHYEDARARNPTDNGWWQWALDVATACAPFSAEPRYHGIICPSSLIRKGVAMICDHARQARKPIYLLGATTISLVNKCIETRVGKTGKAFEWEISGDELPRLEMSSS
jgi:hypothetical protein